MWCVDEHPNHINASWLDSAVYCSDQFPKEQLQPLYLGYREGPTSVRPSIGNHREDIENARS